ncbi:MULTISPECIES: ABC-three component system protein [unclassified Bradyrhizobium]|uniref:ABC-three component system protein n=1 Tax=unclassified Bradyrhizobium TaxID=2631580 RepID=UPI0028ECD6AE|nr:MULTISPECIES: ABC-three component system protein [unclassified Bradyrhizobium]
MTVRVRQDGATAQGDIVGRDKNELHHHHYPASASPGIVEQLLFKLQAEIEKNQEVRHTVEALAHFQARRAPDGIDGLEAKLKAGNRENEILSALEKKEMFVKLLEKWSLYASAQEIFAYLLAKAEYDFNYLIYPKIGAADLVEINQLTHDKIVMPTIEQCGTSVFTLNHGVAMGMLYWLAEQCFVRWH